MRNRHSSFDVKGAKSVDELVARAGTSFAFRVETRPAEVRIPTGDGGFDLVEAPGQVVVRSDTQEPLALVGPRYVPAQVEDFLRPLDEHLRSGELEVSRAYTFEGGRTQVVELEMQGSIKLKSRMGGEDVLKRRLLWRNSHDGSGSLTLVDELLRTICKNGLVDVLGLSKAAFRHTEGAIADALDLGEAFAASRARFDSFEATATKLLGTPFDQKRMDHVVAQLWPAREDGEVTNQAQLARAQVGVLFSHGTGTHGVSAWDAVNAITEYATHHRPVRADGHVATLARLHKLWSGDAFTSRAVGAVLAAAEVELPA